MGVVRDADTEAVASEEGSPLPKIYEPFGAQGPSVVPSFLVASASPQALQGIATLARQLAPTSQGMAS